MIITMDFDEREIDGVVENIVSEINTWFTDYCGADFYSISEESQNQILEKIFEKTLTEYK